jgi:4-phytase/acid phosphatase
MLYLLRLLLGMGLGVAAAAATPLAAAELVLERIVLLSRHGVRAPTASPETLAGYASAPWPEWPAGQGELTARGAELARLMGAYYRAMLEDRGLLLRAGSCPPAGTVRAVADVEQRTVATARAMLDGMFPGCGMEPEVLAGAKTDPLFHPVEAGVCPLDAALAEKAVLGRIGGGFAAVLDAYSPSLAAMQSALGCCAPKLCGKDSGQCKLADVASRLEAGKKGLSVKGPIGIASTAGETFLMQYAQGMDEAEVAWGAAPTPMALNGLLALHQLDLDLAQRTPYLAALQGSAMAAEMLAALGEGLDLAAQGPPEGPAIVLIVGHDTNIAALGGLLGLDWVLATYLPGETPPGGALAFELLRDPASGARFVAIAYYSQTLDQLRNASVLDAAHAPARATIAVPGCIAGGLDETACPWAEFERIVDAAIDPTCVPDRR